MPVRRSRQNWHETERSYVHVTARFAVAGQSCIVEVEMVVVPVQVEREMRRRLEASAKVDVPPGIDVVSRPSLWLAESATSAEVDTRRLRGGDAYHCQHKDHTRNPRPCNPHVLTPALGCDVFASRFAGIPAETDGRRSRHDWSQHEKVGIET